MDKIRVGDLVRKIHGDDPKWNGVHTVSEYPKITWDHCGLYVNILYHGKWYTWMLSDSYSSSAWRKEIEVNSLDIWEYK